MSAETSKFKVEHVKYKEIQLAFNNYELPEGNINKIDRETYVKIVGFVMFKSDLKNRYIKI